MSVRLEIVRDLLRRFPTSPSKTLAGIAYRDNPTVFLHAESARDAVREIRGAKGPARKLKYATADLIRPPQQPGDPFAQIPEGKTHFKEWGAFRITGPANALILSDIHIPYHDKAPLVATLNYGRKNGADTIILNGDTADFFSVSKWEKDPRKRKLKEEIETVRMFLVELRKLFPKARIIFKDGNHEERWTSYLYCKAPEIVDMPEFELPEVLKFKDAGIEDYVTDKRCIRLGNLNVIHGHEYRFAISNPVNPARGLFLRAKAHALCAHFHQKSEHSEKNVEQKTIATWSTGCLCGMHPDYAPYNNWSHGFAMVQVDKDGGFEVQNKYIAAGKVY
jgi:predicted phosphodiesterase